MSEKYFVTGANGFVGSAVVRELVRQQKNVAVLVRSKKNSKRLANVKTKISFYESDLLNSDLQKIISDIRPTHIYHFASYGTMPNQNNTELMIDVNNKGLYRLIEALKKVKFSIFINTGTSSEYGVKNKSMNEKDILAPVNDYGVTKAAATLYCQKVAIKESLPIITYRLFSAYGYYEQPTRLIPWVITNALLNKPIHLSSPHNVRDFTFIEDIVNAYLKTVSIDVIPGEIYNIGTGKQHTTKEVVETILSLTKSKSEVLWNKMAIQERQMEPMKWEADITKAKKVLSWQPEYTLKRGLTKTINWFQNNLQFYDK